MASRTQALDTNFPFYLWKNLSSYAQHSVYYEVRGLYYKYRTHNNRGKNEEQWLRLTRIDWKPSTSKFGWCDRDRTSGTRRCRWGRKRFRNWVGRTICHAVDISSNLENRSTAVFIELTDCTSVSCILTEWKLNVHQLEGNWGRGRDPQHR